ncbi:hypothetical protein CLCY_2c03690 [Clostridium cylindrosporum DSM 605]|uniref:Uncharacterized protein n=2 Tax=Clostridium cylindrosporum TaxID=1495 RepID=A0A0J8D6W5_CLOCY|nr:hypothetical protein CLCY_2c03690 [Clostridium cylindrosporum DSM 605]
MKAREKILYELNKRFICERNEAVPIIYLIKKTNFEKKMVYQGIHELLNMELIERVFISVCPICYESNLHINESEFSIIRCNYCKEMYNNNDYIEKYRIKEEN